MLYHTAQNSGTNNTTTPHRHKSDKAISTHGDLQNTCILPKASLCPDCAVAKSRVRDIGRKSTRDREPPTPFQTVALVIWGPMPTPDIGGNRWVLGGVCYKTSLIFGNLKSDATVT